MFDVIVIGGGPGGGSAAIYAASRGAKVALVERDEIGGVCLNKGCIPTKSLLASVRRLKMCKEARIFGLGGVDGVTLNLSSAQGRTSDVVANLRRGLMQYYKMSKVEIIKGFGRVVDRGVVEVDGRCYKAKDIVIATGSAWRSIPELEIDRKVIVTSDDALFWNEAPARLAIIGGGAIGCEFASLYSGLGTKVFVIEAMDSLLPAMDRNVGRELMRAFKRDGIEVYTSTTVGKSCFVDSGVALELTNGANLEVDKVLVAVGRKPSFDGVGVEEVGIEVERGAIKVNDYCQTSAPNIYAVGDVVGNPMLAHKADADGMTAAAFITGVEITRTKVVPSPVFTLPEVAGVGVTEGELKASGAKFKSARVRFGANGKAVCEGEENGLAVFYSEEGSGKLLGAHFIGAEASLLAAEVALAIEKGLTAMDVAMTIHAHPTLSEIVRDGCLELLDNLK